MAILIPLLILFLSLLTRITYNTISSYYLTPKRLKKIMENQQIYGPKPKFLIGNISQMSSLIAQSTATEMKSISHDIVGRLLPHYVAWSKEFGKRFVYWNGTEPRLCLTEIELIRELLGKYSSISGKSWLQQEGSKHFIGKGLLMANGNDWYNQRHVVAPAFMGDRLKSYAGSMVECTKMMLESLEKEVKSGETEYEISKYMTALTAGIISGTEFDSSYEKGKQIFQKLTVLQNLCARSSRHLCLPGSRFFPSTYNLEIKALKTEVEKLLMEIIQSPKDGVEIGRSSSYGNDLLGMLLNEMQKKKGNGLSLNLQVIMDECKTFFFAGHETTALLLTWTVMLLATNPIWQEKVRQEINNLCRGETPSLDHLSKLTWLNMVINESLRLYPPASVLPRMAFEDIKLGQDLHIPKGLSIWIPVLAIHHSEELWGKDANQFNPNRFASKTCSNWKHFMPFAAGPRNCVGQAFALMETKIILAMLITRFSFVISEKYRHAPVIILTIKPKYGVQICLKPLNP